MSRIHWTVGAVVASILFVVLAAPRWHQRRMAASPAARSVQVPSGGVALPMESFGGRPVVALKIGERGPYRFILDTGAHVSVVDTSLARELSLPLAPGVRAGAVGEGKAADIVWLENLRLGGLTASGVIAAALPLQALFQTAREAPRGVLSASTFSGQLLTFDYARRTITIRPGELPTPDSTEVFAYGATEPLPSLPVRVAGFATRVHLDTGSADGLTLPRRWLDELPLATAPIVVGKRRTPGHEPTTVERAEVDGRLQIGRFTLDSTAVLFGDIQAGNLEPTGSLGGDVLRSFVVTLDAANRRIRLAR